MAPLQLGPEVDEEAGAELDDDPESDEWDSEPDWRFIKEIEPGHWLFHQMFQRDGPWQVNGFGKSLVKVV